MDALCCLEIDFSFVVGTLPVRSTILFVHNLVHTLAAFSVSGKPTVGDDSSA